MWKSQQFLEKSGNSLWGLTANWTGGIGLVLIGFYTQNHLPVSCFFQDPGLHLLAQAAGPPWLGSIYLLLPVCNLGFSYFRIFQMSFLYLRTWVWVFLRKLFAEFAFRATFRNVGVWNHLTPASLSLVDVLCSTTFVLFMFWLSEQQWWEGAAWEGAVTFPACRAKWLGQNEPKTVHTSQFWFIHCYLLTCMKGFYLRWRVFHIPCNNCEICQQECRKINLWAHPGGFGCWWMHIWKVSPVLMVGSQYLHYSCF